LGYFRIPGISCPGEDECLRSRSCLSSPDLLLLFSRLLLGFLFLLLLPVLADLLGDHYLSQ
jgi:hypothetical protein